MTEPNFRALCDQLANKLAMHCGDNEYAWDLIERTHAALATSPPEPPTKGEVIQLAILVIDTRPYWMQTTAKDPVEYEMTEEQLLAFASALLERWGKSSK